MWPQQHAPSQMMQAAQQPQQYARAPASSNEIRSLWIGDLKYWMDETYITSCFYNTGEGAKVVSDRTTGRSKGYGFVGFGDESEQIRAMSEMNGVLCSSRPM